MATFVFLNTGLTRACINGHRLVEVTYAEKALLYQSSRQHNIRHLACTTRPKGYFATMITRYADSHSTFRLRRLLSCGNISKNSGPVGALNLRSMQIRERIVEMLASYVDVCRTPKSNRRPLNKYCSFLLRLCFI